MASSGGGRAGKDELAAELGALKRKATASPFQVLDVAPDAGERVIHAAFLQATKRLHPNRFAREPQDVRDLASEAFLIVRKAWSELEDEHKRKQWREKVAARSSASPYGPAPTPAPHVPVRSNPPIPMPHAPAAAPAAALPASHATPTAAGASTLLEQVRSRDLRTEQAITLLGAGKAAEARAILEHLIAEDAGARKARLYLHYARAHVLREAGKPDDARRELERALALDPKFAPALAELNTLGPAKPAGVFARLGFGSKSKPAK